MSESSRVVYGSLCVVVNILEANVVSILEVNVSDKIVLLYTIIVEKSSVVDSHDT